MKVKDLLEEIDRCKAQYADFLEWDIYTEQIDEGDKNTKRGTAMKRRNTERDNWIRKIYKIGDGEEIGQQWGISRQRVWQIRREGLKRRWGLLWLK